MADSTPTPVPAPAPKPGRPLKIIFISLVILAALAIVFVAMLAHGCYHLVRSVGRGTPSMTAADSGKLTAADLGTEIYPGATPEQGGSKITSPSGSTTTGVYSTPDSVDKVEAFYKDKLGSDATDQNIAGTAILSKRISKTETVTVTANSKPEDTHGRTQILIVEVTSITK